MSEPGFSSDDFQAIEAGAHEALVVDLDGFEGPLDLLLALARTQKVDIARMSMLALADQYLAFVEQAEALRLELAADYLVMAAWLAFLKSRLLLPRDEPEAGPSGEELAARLAFRLQRLGAMREASARLFARPLLDRDVHARGAPEAIRIVRESQYRASLYDLLKAYADQRLRNHRTTYTVKARHVWSIKEARTRLERLVGAVGDWTGLEACLRRFLPLEASQARSAVASSLGAILELAREGQLEIRQSEPFGPIHIRRRPAGSLRLVAEQP